MSNITPINPESFELQGYSPNDQNLVPLFNTSSNFSISKDIVESYVYDVNQSLLYYDFDYRGYQIIQEGNSQGFDILSNITVNPEENLIGLGFDQGEYNILYKFFNNKLGSSFNIRYYIKEISPSRQEIRITSNELSNEEIETFTNEFITERENSSFFVDFKINFGDNVQYIANNILLDSSDPNQYNVLIKLYEPLPGNISLGDTLWVGEETSEPLGFNVVFPPEEILIQEGISLRGPNLNIELSDQVNNSTGLVDFETLTTTALTSSFNQLASLFEEKGIEINIDYTEFSNFIHFSSAEQRIRNFYYKIGLIEGYQSDINSILTITGSTSESIEVVGSISNLEGKITNIIENFDGFEYYMYYESNSIAYPKVNSEPPFILQSSGDQTVLDWLEERLVSASDFDNTNQNALVYTIPEYLRDDPQNAPYELFIEMVGQHFDNLYLYVKDITNLHNADNRLNFGISKDLVADALKSFGVKLYQNNFSSNDLYTAYLGINESGSYLPPTGSEIIDNYITSSDNPTPLDDINKEIYKRIYHNLPYLLKRKGTIEGVRALINCYGIPDTILRISEFGGKDRDNTDDYDYWYNRFNYALDTKGLDRIIIPWVSSSNEFGGNYPETIMFRFKTDGLPPKSHQIQPLLAFSNIDEDNNALANRFHLRLEYTGSYLDSGSYSGSIPSQSNEYGDLYFSYNSNILNINAPFFNGGWWSIMLQTGSNNSFYLYAKQNIYNGNDGDQIGYEFSASISNPGDNIWDDPSYERAYLGGTWASTIWDKVYFSGSLQELRFYNTQIHENVFNDFVMNPTSIEGNQVTESFSSLIFRAPLGNELQEVGNDYILPLDPTLTSTLYLTSSHPAVKPNSNLLISQSFSTGDSIYTASLDNSYKGSHLKGLKEVYYLDSPIVGIKNRVSNKIRNENIILPSDKNTTLSPFRSIQQFDRENESSVRDINLLEVAFSPQNEINDDIIAGLGHFNIGEYIGDPKFISESNTRYPDLVKLSEEHFKKYYKSYDLVDYVRLIKYFDNSLFKMIKDFVPARTSLTTGIVIKQHLLERNRYRQPQLSFTQPEYSASIKSGFIEGGAGGVMNKFNGLNTSPFGINSESLSNVYNLTQSWEENIVSPLGEVNQIHDSQDEFYNGEFSGSTLLVTDGELNDENKFKYPDTIEISYNIIFYTSSVTPLEAFNNINTSPNQGEIYLWYDTGSILNPQIQGPGGTQPGGITGGN
jgi:spore coat protein CotF